MRTPKFASESGVIVKITRNKYFHCDKTELLKTQYSMSYIGDIWGFVFMNKQGGWVILKK